MPKPTTRTRATPTQDFVKMPYKQQPPRRRGHQPPSDALRDTGHLALLARRGSRSFGLGPARHS